MVHTQDEYTCDECGNELTEDGNSQLFCPTCRFNNDLSMGMFDEEIVDGEEYVRVGGVTFKLPYVDNGFDGLGLCPKCHGAETPNGSLCRVCANEARDDAN